MGKTFSHTEIMGSCKCFPHVDKMPTLPYNWVNRGVVRHLWKTLA